MTLITPLLGEKILVKLGDGQATETFAHPSFINTSRSVSVSTNTESDELVDLADQSAPAQIVRRVKSVDFKVDGAGMINKADVKEWLDWATGTTFTVRNIQVTDGENWVIEGPFVLTSFQISGERTKSSTCQLTLEQAGECTVTAFS